MYRKKNKYAGLDVSPLKEPRKPYKSFPDSVLRDQAFSYSPTHRLGHNTFNMRTARPNLCNFVSFIKIMGRSVSTDYDVILAKDCRFDKTMKIYLKTDTARLQASCAERNNWVMVFGYSLMVNGKRYYIAEAFYEPMKLTMTMIRKRQRLQTPSEPLREIEVAEDKGLMDYLKEVLNK